MLPRPLGGYFPRDLVYDGIPQTIDRVGKKIDRTFQRRQNLQRVKTRALQRADIAIEQKRVFAAVKVMQRMSVKESSEVGLLADHMLTRGHQNSARTKHAIHLGTGEIEITGVMQDRPGKDNIEQRHRKTADVRKIPR